MKLEGSKIKCRFLQYFHLNQIRPCFSTKRAQLRRNTILGISGITINILPTY